MRMVEDWDSEQAKQKTEAEGDESEMGVLIHAALDGPARPMRADQVDALVRLAVTNRQDKFPGWALVLLGFGPLVVIAAGYLMVGQANGLMSLALVIPVMNLALSPLAAFLVVRQALGKNSLHEEDKR